MGLTVAQLQARLTADTSSFTRGMATADASVKRSSSAIPRGLTYTGAAIGIFAALSARSAGNFQESMNVLNAVSGATSDQSKALSKRAIKLGNDLKLPAVSAKDAADAMVELSKGGLTVKDTLKATRGVLQLGTAAQISYTDAADDVARALHTFQLNGSQTKRVVNVLSATTNKSTATMQDMTDGMQSAGSAFHLAGFSIEDLSASLGIMVDNGISGANAGTTLKVMLQRLQSPTGKAADTMDDLGVSIYDAHGKMKPLPNIIGQFTRATHGLTDAQKQQALNTIFGSRANKGMAILMQKGAKGYVKYRDAVTGTNAAQKMAEAHMKGLNGAIEALKGQVETLMIQFGTKLLPVLTSGAKIFSKIIGVVSRLVQASPVLQAVLAGITATIFALIVGLKAWAVAQAILDGVLDANPIVLIAAAIIGLGAALVYAYKNSETFRNIVNGVFSWLKNAVLTTIDFVKSHWLLILGALAGPIGLAAVEIYKHWDAIKTATKDAFDAVKKKITDVFNAIKTAVQTAVDAVKLAVTTVWNALKLATTTTWDAIKKKVSDIWDAIKNAVGNALSSLKTAITNAWAAVKTMTSNAWDAVRDAVVAMVDKIVAKIKGLPDAVKKGLGDLGGLLKQAGKDLINGLKAGIESAAQGVIDAAKSVAGKITGALKGMLGIGSPSRVMAEQVGVPIVQGLMQGMQRELSSSLYPMLSRLAPNIMQTVGMTSPLAPAVGAPAPARSITTMQVTVPVQVMGSLVHETEIGTYIRGIITEEARRGRFTS